MLVVPNTPMLFLLLPGMMLRSNDWCQGIMVSTVDVLQYTTCCCSCFLEASTKTCGLLSHHEAHDGR